jgi:chromate transporter
MFENEFVQKRKWLSHEHFLDLVGATNLIPGPNSTEMTMHIGFERGKTAGLFVAGAMFILPAVLITGVLALLYVEFGSLPQIAPFFIGMQPAVVVVILAALLRLGNKALKNWQLGAVGAAVFIASSSGMDEVLTLFAGGLIGMVWLRYFRGKQALLLLPAGLLSNFAANTGAATGVSLLKLGLFFLKIGAVLYGSGYVLIAFLEGSLVSDYGWLTKQQLLDAIAIGQFTPGPILSTATFIGYTIAGVPGALIATVGIFLPSFIFVLILNPLIPKLRQSALTAAFLDAVNVAAVALMASVTFKLAYTVLRDWQSWLILLCAGLAVFMFKINVVILILGAAALGYVLTLLPAII